MVAVGAKIPTTSPGRSHTAEAPVRPDQPLDWTYLVEKVPAGNR